MARIVLEPEGASARSEILIEAALPHPLLPERASRGRIAVVTTAATPYHSVVSLLDQPQVKEVAEGEEAKSLDTLAAVYEWLQSIDLGRDGTVVAVGGGAVSDLAGFAAATWLRGVELVSVPTTLLGAVDAAIGGKTGINFSGKNLVGAFHLPTRVAISIDLLSKLPIDLRRQGMAEAIKAGYVGDPGLVDLLATRGLDAPLSEVVERAVAVKADTVNGDFRESDRRAILNFGHTIGHAIEILAPMPHGSSVAVGMVAAGVISHALYGFDQRPLIDNLFALGLPVAAGGVSLSAAHQLIQRDKKKTQEGIRMVLLQAVGTPVVTPVEPKLIELGLAAIGAS